MTATYDSIATTTLSSAASTITFSSIPNTFTDLRLVLVGTANPNAYPAIQFNNDTASNYSSTVLSGNGSAASSTVRTSADQIRDVIIFTNDANVSLWEVDIFSYAGSTNKTVLIKGSGDKNGSGITSAIVGLWRSTSAITSIQLTPNLGTNFSIGTTATLYGIKAE